nr:hypothetical protein Iba_chr12aCG16830 [Ipomoea batatas]GMD64198.1 hypothetical protein Iba_chr12bCG22120 [Ipomoea batatas]
MLLSNKLAPLPEKENASSSSRPKPADVRQTFRHIYRSGEGNITLLYIQLQVICSDLFAGSCTSATMGMVSSAMNAASIPFIGPQHPLTEPESPLQKRFLSSTTTAPVPPRTIKFFKKIVQHIKSTFDNISST